MTEVDTASQLAHRLGLKFADAVLIGAGTNALVHLRPQAVVARVSRLAHLIWDADVLAGGIALARALGPDRAVQPASLLDPGPHVADGRHVTFWEYRTGVTASAREAGTALRQLHDAAPRLSVRLRPFDPRPMAIRVADLVGGETAALLRHCAAGIVLPSLPEQTVHGDPHFENVLRGGVWQDFDEVCSGPREWDLASMVHRWRVFGEFQAEMRDALRAYGEHDLTLIDAMQPAVVLWIAAFASLAPLIGEPISQRTMRRYAWLRDRVA